MTLPHTIGRYEVEHLLGEGGMGRVWLARDTVLGRRVAIKVLRDDLPLPPSVRAELGVRMRHEARAAAAVSHPNIVTLYDMGEDDAFGLFLVFEYVPGPRSEGPESLRDRLRGDGASPPLQSPRSCPIPLADVARLAREVGSALTFAHAAGVVHRDIKPENILFSRTGAKIADFGIARIPESTITRASRVLGTPAYTSPEALSNGDFSAASDQFAFAATLYEATTGICAFAGPDAITTAGNVSKAALPPVDPCVGSPAVVRCLGAALSKGVAKDVAGRFASCIDLGEAVARAIERPTDADAATDPGGATGRVVELEIERPPLSSRVALERSLRPSERSASTLTPYSASRMETPVRPSIIIRKQTRRWQNMVTAAALVVIVVLILLGRKKQQQTSVQDVASAREVPSGAPPKLLKARHPTPTPPAASPSPSSSATVVED